jgi:hypothetical protein
MRNEMVITEADLNSRFQGERDLITYAPYRVGDRVVRCGACRAVIKSEFVTRNTCPLCGRTPFSPTPVVPPPEGTGNTGRVAGFAWWLLLAVAAAYIPFAFPKAAAFLFEAAFGIGPAHTLLCVGVIALVAAAVVFFHKGCRRLWQTSRSGALLVFVPVTAPYCVLATVWIGIFTSAIAAALAVCALIIYFIARLLE